MGRSSFKFKKILKRISGTKDVLVRNGILRQKSKESQIKICENEKKINETKNHLNDKVNLFCQQINDNASQNERQDTFSNDIITKNESLCIRQSFMIKRMNDSPIRVVFLIEELSLLKNMLSLIEEINSDKRFEAIIVSLWFKEYHKNGYDYICGDIRGTFDATKYNILESYNKETDEWLDLKSLKPDYVFFSRPYDYYRKDSYFIKEVSKYARTCYIPYGIQTVGGDIEKMVLTPECQHLNYFFLDNKLRYDFVNNTLAQTDFAQYGRAIYLGYPGIDILLKNEQIKSVRENEFKILWLPRWNTDEGNCHFFDYKDTLVDFSANQENCSVIFRPHPLCFKNFLNKGEMCEDDIKLLREQYSAPNRIDETDSYLESFQESSVLIADETSMIAEYFITGKPIVFCKKQTHFSALMEKLVEGCYVVENEDELVEILKKIKNGEDSLKEVRKSITEEYLTDFGQSAAINIKEELLSDFNAEYPI